MKGVSIIAMLITLVGISISVLGRGEHHRKKKPQINLGFHSICTIFAS